MQEVPLQAVANQAFTVLLDDIRFDLRLKDANGVMVADITADDVPLVSATRVLAGEPIIPYKYLEAGNFLVLTEDGELPAYAQFGQNQSMIYLSAAEIAAL